MAKKNTLRMFVTAIGALSIPLNLISEEDVAVTHRILQIHLDYEFFGPLR